MEFNLDGFADVSDTDGANDNSICVALGVGVNSPAHDFVDEKLEVLRSSVSPMTTNDTPKSMAFVCSHNTLLLVPKGINVNYPTSRANP